MTKKTPLQLTGPVDEKQLRQETEKAYAANRDLEKFKINAGLIGKFIGTGQSAINSIIFIIVIIYAVAVLGLLYARKFDMVIEVLYYALSACAGFAGGYGIRFVKQNDK